MLLNLLHTVLAQKYCGILVQLDSSSVTFLSFAALLTLKASPVARNKISCNVFRLFNGVLFGSIQVPAYHIFHG